MTQTLLHVALVVGDYDEALEFYCGKLHFLRTAPSFTTRDESHYSEQSVGAVVDLLTLETAWRRMTPPHGGTSGTPPSRWRWASPRGV